MAHRGQSDAHRTPRSLLGQSVVARLALVGAMLALLWATVYWSLS